jgi:ribosomal protein S18 acetylase RimI-like enzyme
MTTYANFRLLGPLDAPAYRSLRQRALAEAPQYVGPLGEREAMSSVEDLQTRLTAYPGEGVSMVGGFVDGICTAAAGLNRSLNHKYAHKMFLWGMYVLPEHRGCSLGRQLLEHLLALAREQAGVRFVQLQVTSTNDPAVSLYRRGGFVRYGLEPSALRLDGRDYDFALMQCELSAPRE